MEASETDLPIALRRTRRSIAGTPGTATHDVKPLEAAAKTPRRGAQRRVRFSGSGPSAADGTTTSSGLTPMIRRVAVTTPKRRHSSAPASCSGNTIVPSSPGLPHAGEVTFLPLRQVLDGRVQRRIRRNGLSEEMNTIQHERRRRALDAKAEMDRLKSELKARDREIYELQNATIVMDTDRIWDLEQQVDDLKQQLTRRSGVDADQSRGYNWTLSARDPFARDFTDMMVDDDQFGEETMAQLACSTPSRAKSSFPTPPSTSPLLPGTPCSLPAFVTPKSHAGVQVCLPDTNAQRLEEEVSSLQLEICKLTTTLDSYKALSGRLEEKLSGFAAESADDSQAGGLEAQLHILLQTMSDRTCALGQLTTAISDLGFTGSDAAEMIISLASGFRAARLELEYLTPGEIALPLSSHGAEVLDLLLSRLRDMATKAKEDEASIDEYHEIEQSLRKQLDARVCVMDGLKAEMSKAEKMMGDKLARIKELEVANLRLKGAVDGYIRDIEELEKLVQNMERDGRDAEATRHAQQESHRRILCGKEDNIAELEAKLKEALVRSADLQQQMADLQEAKSKEVSTLTRKQGADLAVRDARVTELRDEIDRVNDSLRAAHESICGLRVDNGGLQNQVDQEKARAKAVIDTMKEELQRVLQMSQEFLNTPKKPQRKSMTAAADQDELSLPALPSGAVIQSGGYLSGGLARRSSKKSMKRGFDSGVGLLDEDEVEMF